MKASIRDKGALAAVSPVALSAYARSAGWIRTEPYGDHSDVYAADGLPEIVLPKTRQIGDYANVVSQVIEIFAQTADMDELALYRDLVTADRDVIRVRAASMDEGEVSLADGVNLVNGARDMLWAAACSLRAPRPLYEVKENKEANDYLGRVHLGQTEQGSFTVTLLTPIVPPVQQPSNPDITDDGSNIKAVPLVQQFPNPEWNIEDDPIERQVTKRLSEALGATREAIERTATGDDDAFITAVPRGTSANLCEALVKLVEPFPSVDVGLSWARTRPREKARDVVRFDNDHAPILKGAAISLRERKPEISRSRQVIGFVQRLKRSEDETAGTITLRADIDGASRSVTTVLNPNDYEQAIRAHRDKSRIVVKGDLERVGQQWRLQNPRISGIGQTLMSTAG